jgi:NAD(P)-dependent dehydrogenase (short-subunit alcohol dehydrogenase family)
MAEFGAKVVVSSRKQEAVDEVAAALKTDGHDATAVACHVGDTNQLQSLVDAALETYGGIDIVVNNAAANPYFGPVVGADDGLFDKIMGVNVRAPLELSRRAFPTMEKRGGGAVINISSIGGLSPEPMLGLYSVSKAALISLTKVLAAEWGPAKIRVNAICPGLVKTKFSRALWENDDVLRRFETELPLRRIASPEEIAPLAVFLASEAASYCTGGVYTVDGGHTI